MFDITNAGLGDFSRIQDISSSIYIVLLFIWTTPIWVAKNRTEVQHVKWNSTIYFVLLNVSCPMFRCFLWPLIIFVYFFCSIWSNFKFFVDRDRQLFHWKKKCATKQYLFEVMQHSLTYSFYKKISEKCSDYRNKKIWINSPSPWEQFQKSMKL